MAQTELRLGHVLGHAPPGGMTLHKAIAGMHINRLSVLKCDSHTGARKTSPQKKRTYMEPTSENKIKKSRKEKRLMCEGCAYPEKNLPVPYKGQNMGLER